MASAFLGLALNSSTAIAAAVIEQGYAVLTANLRHFQKIPGLTVAPV